MPIGEEKSGSGHHSIDRESLVTVYIGLVEVSEQNKNWDSSDVADNIGFDTQRTEILLDELAHMGLVEDSENWIPLVS